MGMPGGFEIVLIVMVILLLFGAKRIPELAKGIGQGIQEFRKASDDIKKEIDKGADEVKNATSPNSSDKEKETESKSDK